MYNPLFISPQWLEEYHTVYPHGYSVMENLIDWVNQVNNLIDYVNGMNLEHARFIEEFPKLGFESDDTGRLQRALDSGYNIILQKNMTYTVSDVLINKTALKIYGNGAKLRTLNPAGSCLIISATSENIQIENLTFEGSSDGVSDLSAGIKILHKDAAAGRNDSAKNIDINGCRFIGGFVFSVMASGVTGLKVRNCFGTGNRYIPSVSAGGYFVLLQSCYDVEVYHNIALAGINDRHAVYVSCNNALSGDKANENINVHHNIFDWRNVGTPNFQAVMVIRTTRNINVSDNHIRGGYGGILVNPSHGDIRGVNIHDNQVTDLLTSTNEHTGIGSVPQDKGGSFKVREMKIHDNIIKADGERIIALTTIDTVGFEITGNTVDLKGSTSGGAQIYNTSNGIITGNRMEGNLTARRGFMLAGTLDSIGIGLNMISHFQYEEEESAPVFSNIKRVVWI